MVEAGLGGRLDATNTIPSRVTVLTSIGLDHTEWLGETELEIAAEKLAVLRDHTTLVLGRVTAEVAALAERTAAERGARAGRRARGPRRRRCGCAPPGASSAATSPSPGRRRGLPRRSSTPSRGRRTVAGGALDGPRPPRADRRGPADLLDAAHNPDGAAALAEALPEVAGGRPVIACLAILADKDAAAMIAALAPALDRAVCTELPRRPLEGHGRPGPARARRAELAAACEAAGLPAEAEPDFGAALAGPARWPRSRRSGVLLVTGSHYVSARRAPLSRPTVRGFATMCDIGHGQRRRLRTALDDGPGRRRRRRR